MAPGGPISPGSEDAATSSSWEVRLTQTTRDRPMLSRIIAMSPEEAGPSGSVVRPQSSSVNKQAAVDHRPEGPASSHGDTPLPTKAWPRGVAAGQGVPGRGQQVAGGTGGREAGKGMFQSLRHMPFSRLSCCHSSLEKGGRGKNRRAQRGKEVTEESLAEKATLFSDFELPYCHSPASVPPPKVIWAPLATTPPPDPSPRQGV